MKNRQQSSPLILVSILFLLGTALSGCGESPAPSTHPTASDGIIRSSDQYAVGITTDQKIYTGTTTSPLAVKLLSQGASPSSPFNGVQLFIHVPEGMVLSKIESSDPNMTAKPPKDEGNNVFQILLYGGNQTSDRKDGFATLTFLSSDPSAKGNVQIISSDKKISTIIGDQNTNAHSIPTDLTLFSIQ